MAYSTAPWCMHTIRLGIQLLLASMLVVPVPGSGYYNRAVVPVPGSGYYHRAELIHVDANGGFTREELIRRAADRAHLRAAMLSSADNKMKVQLEGQSSHFEYLMRMEVDIDGGEGKQPVRLPFYAVADTGSDMVWISMKGSSYEPVPCSCTGGKDEKLFAFTRTYGSGKKAAKGFICKYRKLSFLSPSNTKETNRNGVTLGFAIHHDHDLIPESADGIVGLSRGKLSLVRQLGVAKFSYCLSNPLIPREKEKPLAPFWFGGAPIFSDLQSTPLVKVLSHEDRYHVELLGISFDDGEKIELQQHDFSYKSEQGNGAMFIDSGCSYTFLEKLVFSKLMEHLVGKLGAPHDITKDDQVHTCFPADKAEQAPALLLHLQNDAQMRIPRANYLLRLEPGKPDLCLAINESPADVSILGNIQQHDMYMHYDLTREQENLSFKQVPDCSKL